MKPIIYQVVPRYWGAYESQNVRNASLSENGCGHFADFDDASLNYIKGLGCTHVWYTGVIRHATACNTCGCRPSHPSFLKGAAGSPYAITDYYDVNPYLAVDAPRRMVEFEELVKRTHAKGLKVIIDFIPNHVSRDNVNFGQHDDKSVHWKAENDFYYYPGQKLNLPTMFYPTAEYTYPYYEEPARATGNNCFTASPSINDWYETVKLNYCDFHTGTWDKMLDILRFWASKGVDGFRCDMVELVPSEFFEWVIAKMKTEFPGIIFIAEVYKKELYRYYLRNVGFDYLYDKSGLYDTLRDIMSFNSHNDGRPEQWQSTRRITSGWQKMDHIQPLMLNFLENHDEQRVASDFFLGNAEQAFAGFAVSALFNNAALMIYSGQELGERGMNEEGFSSRDGRSTIFDWWKADTMRHLWDYIHGKGQLTDEEARILEKYRKVMALAASKPCCDGKNFDLCYCNEMSRGFDPDKHFAFLRYDDEKCLLVACNFSGKDADMDIHVPAKSCNVAVKVEAFSYCVKEL